jgi:hypothetical protein
VEERSSLFLFLGELRQALRVCEIGLSETAISDHLPMNILADWTALNGPKIP